MDFYNLLIDTAKKDGIVKNVVAGIVLNKNKEVLIMTRKLDDFMGGIDELPSGNMEAYENIYTSLTRELKEETGLDLENVISYVNSFDYVSGSGKKARQFNFIVSVKSTDSVVLSEHDNYKWLTIEEIRSNPKITEEAKFTLEICCFNHTNKILIDQ